MTNYVCVELVDSVCQQWAVQTNLLEYLAITPKQAGEISMAIITSFIIGWVFGEIGSFIKSMAN